MNTCKTWMSGIKAERSIWKSRHFGKYTNGAD